MKVDTYLKLIKIARYAPLIALVAALLLNEGKVGTLGERIPKGKDDSLF